MAFLNPFTLKKYSAIILACSLTTVMFFFGLAKWSLLIGIAFYLATMLLVIIIANALLSNPFSKMLEGKGILAINIDSTGILRPFVLAVQPPYLKGKLFKKKVDDIFNRSTIAHLAAPIKSETPAKITKDKGILIDLGNEEYNKARFQLYHYPVVLYNQQIDSVITKDFLSNVEKDTFAEHGVLYLNKKVEELTSIVRDFARHVVETLKPKGNFLQSKWVIIVIVIFLIIMGIMFLPNIIAFVKGVSGNIGEAGSKLTDTVTPK